MATVTSDIHSGGSGSYTTISAWEADTDLNSGADIWKGVITDNAAYDESVTINGGGTNNTTSYVWLTVAAANRHAGVWDTGKARIAYTGAATAALQLESDYVMLEWLQIYRPLSGSIGTSDEGIRVGAGADTGCLISRCLIWTESEVGQASLTDGVYVGSTDLVSLFIDHCVIVGWARGGVHLQQNSGVHDQNVTIDHSAMRAGGDKTDQGTLNLHQNGSSGSDTVATVYNTWLREVSYTPDGADVYTYINNVGDSITLAGSHNAFLETDLDNGSENATVSWTNNQTGITTSSPVDTAPGVDEIYITEEAIDGALFDATPVDHANNVLLGNGTNRIGSEPDPRQDFSVDITGATRGTTDVDIGPFQITAGAGGSNITGTPTVVAVTAGVADVTGHADVDGAPTVVTVESGTGQVAAQADVEGTATVVAVTAGVADVGGHAAVTGSPTLIGVTSGVAQVTAQADVEGVPTVVAVTSGVGQVSTAPQVTGTPTVIAVTSGVADIGGEAAVAGSPTIVAVTAGVADIAGHADVGGVPTIIAVTSGVADLSGVPNVAGTPTVIAVRSGVAQVTAQADVAGVSTVVAVTSGVAQIGGGVLVTGSPTIVAVTAGVADIDGHASVTGSPTVVAVMAGVGQLTAQADVEGVPTIIAVLAGAVFALAADNPATLSIRETGHTVTVRETGHVVTAQEQR